MSAIERSTRWGSHLENFDPIGRWRTNYSPKVAIESSGELPGGKQFNSVEDFKSLMLEQHEQFAKAFTEKLFAYAIGRHIDARDRPDVDAILDAVDDDQYPLRDLIKRIAISNLFRSH